MDAGAGRKCACAQWLAAVTARLDLPRERHCDLIRRRRFDPVPFHLAGIGSLTAEILVCTATLPFHVR